MKNILFLIALLAGVSLVASEANAELPDNLLTKYLYPQEVKDCRFTTDNRYVLAAAGKTIYKYGALTGQLVSSFKDSCDNVIYRMDFAEGLNIIPALLYFIR